jgi:Kef-type K+ transport system membrane component KefB
MTHELFPVFLIVTGAAGIPLLARRYGFPTAAIEMVYGAVLAYTLLTEKPEWLDFFQELGFIFLMFIAGMELNIRSLVKNPKLKWFFLISLSSFMAAPTLMHLLGFPYYLGIAVAVMSVGIVIPVLKELEIRKAPLGQDLIGIALTGELLSITVLTGLEIYHRNGLTIHFAADAFKLILLLLIGALTLKIIYLIAWWNPEKVRQIMESQDPVEEGIRFVLAIAFAGALIAALAGVDAILGSFMAGVIFSYIFTYKGVFQEKVDAVGFGFFVPIFFIGIGFDFEIRSLFEPGNALLVLILFVMLFVAHLPPFFFRKALGHSPRESLSFCLLLSAPLTLLIAASEIGFRMQMLNQNHRAALILNAVVASVIYPFLFKQLFRSGTPEPRKITGIDTQK